MSQEQAIEEFIGITGLPKSVAEQYLGRNEYDVMLAVNDYYNNENVEPGTKVKPSSNQPSSSNVRSSGSMFRSLADLHGDKGNSDDNDDKDDMNFFTGGEKSGLAVENPNKNKPKNSRSLVDELIEKAQNESSQPDWRDNEPKETNKKQKAFKGTGYSLGSVENDINSTVIKDPNETSKFNKVEKVSRTITFWKEGFSIDDGELYKYDDPQNQEYLKQLNMGRAPLSLLNVQMFQDVDVNVVKKLEESYHDNQKAKPRVFGFQGSGNRLGSPVPGEPKTVEEAMMRYGSNKPTSESEAPPSKETTPKAKEPNGDTTIQIRLASGARLIQKFNSTDKVEEIYKFVLSKAEDSNRSWNLVTSFPTQALDDKKDKTIAETGLKNSVVIQKWL